MAKKPKLGIRIYNDDLNQFKFVVDIIATAFGYHVTQAHQCAMLIEHQGSYVVKIMELSQKKYAELYCEFLTKNGLEAELEVM